MGETDCGGNWILFWMAGPCSVNLSSNFLLMDGIVFALEKSDKHYLSQVIKVLVSQSCLTLCDPMDSSSPGSSVHGILQARILEWVAIPFSRGSSWPRDQTLVSCIPGRFFTIWATRETPRWSKSTSIMLVHLWYAVTKMALWTLWSSFPNLSI